MHGPRGIPPPIRAALWGHGVHMALMNHPGPATVPFGWKNLDTLVLFEAGCYAHSDGTIRVPYRLADGSTFREKIVGTTRSWWGPGNGLIPFGLERVADPN